MALAEGEVFIGLKNPPLNCFVVQQWNNGSSPAARALLLLFFPLSFYSSCLFIPPLSPGRCSAVLLNHYWASRLQQRQSRSLNECSAFTALNYFSMHWDAERQERKLCLHHPLPPLYLRHHHPAIQGAVPLSEVFLGNASRDFSAPLPASVMKSLCSSFSLSFNQILILFLSPGKHMNNEVIILVINALLITSTALFHFLYSSNNRNKAQTWRV